MYHFITTDEKRACRITISIDTSEMLGQPSVFELAFVIIVLLLIFLVLRVSILRPCSDLIAVIPVIGSLILRRQPFLLRQLWRVLMAGVLRGFCIMLAWY